MKAEAEILGHHMVFRTWTYGEKQVVLRKVTKWINGPEGIKPEIDPGELNDQMLLATLVEWDLKDEKGQPLPITLENLRGDFDRSALACGGCCGSGRRYGCSG
jgi:hypothetical protein